MRIGRYVMAAVAVVFGLMTLREGGAVLFGSDGARQAAGDYVGFVVWFNFLAGFAYVVAGVGFALRWEWSRWLAVVIAAGSAIVFGIFALHIMQGGAYETRTVAAMTFRTLLWAALAGGAFFLARTPRSPRGIRPTGEPEGANTPSRV